MRRFHFAAMLAVLALTAPGVAQTYVTRHADTPAGERDPDLTPTGVARAEALAHWLRGKRIRAIFVSDYRRTRATAAPLATARRLEPIVYDPADTPALIARVRATRGPVLIVGHSNTVPDIIERLGGARPGPLAHEDFGDVWTVRDGRTQRIRIAPLDAANHRK